MTRKRTKQFYTEIDAIADREAFLESVQNGFTQVEDPRALDNQTYSLVYLLVIVICAILAGANTILDICDYAYLKLPMFQKILKIKTAPGYNVFWWLLTLLNPKQLESSLVRWVQSLPEEDKQRLIAIDGKHLRGASRNAKVHLVSAWDSTRSLSLGQLKTEEKSNEVTAIPDLIESLDLKEATVTIAAAGCQTEIVEKIRNGGGHYFIALKRNQGILHAEADNFFTQAKDVGYEDADCVTRTTCEKGHGRIEERQVVVTNQLDWLDCRSQWKDLRWLTEVTSFRTVGDKTTTERRFYISNLELIPEDTGLLAGSHWSVENRLHWIMDVNFGEDASLASVGNAAENLAVFKRLASTMIRRDLGGVRATAQRRRQAAWDNS